MYEWWVAGQYEILTLKNNRCIDSYDLLIAVAVAVANLSVDFQKKSFKSSFENNGSFTLILSDCLPLRLADFP